MPATFTFTTRQKPVINKLIKASKHKFQMDGCSIELEEADYRALTAILNDARIEAILAENTVQDDKLVVLLNKLELLEPHFPNVTTLGLTKE